MRLQDVEAIGRALNDSNVRYLVVGGLAVIAHGYVRATKDVDIVLNLEKQNVLRAMKALSDIGYTPLIPVDPAQFADPVIRQSWIDEKHMIVFQMLNADPRSTRLDLFVKEPFSFEEEFALAKWEEVANVRMPVVRVESLLKMKRASGRPQDLADIEGLRTIIQNKKR